MTKRRVPGTARRTLTLALTGTILAMLTLTSSALATTHHPTGEFAIFADCPLSANPELCLLAKTEGGQFTIGKETVPITNPITLQGAVNGFLTEHETFLGAEDGNTLTKSPQKVPGGLAGLVKCNEISNFLERLACEAIFENGLTGVNATTELAAPATSITINSPNLLEGTGTALALPLKIHLENPFLGSSCYIGSNTSPVTIDFTTGTTSPPEPNKPITGKPGETISNESGTRLTIKNNELVNNSYPAPGAEGCGGIFSFLIDPIVDAKLGIPSAAGHNTAILKGTLNLADAEAVKASE